MRALLLIAALSGGCLDYDALTNGVRGDLSSELGAVDLAGDDLVLVPPDLTVVDLAGADLAGRDQGPQTSVPQLIVSSAVNYPGTALNTFSAVPGTQPGDVVLMIVWWNNPSLTPTLSGEPFISLATTQVPGSEATRWYWRLADTNESTSTYILSFASNVDSAMIAIVFRGASSVASSAASARTAADWPVSITTTVPNTAVVPIVTYATNAGGWTAPAGFSLATASPHAAAFVADVATTQVVTIAQPQSDNAVTPLLTDVLLVQP